MNQEQTDITTGKQIRHLRTQSGMTQGKNWPGNPMLPGRRYRIGREMLVNPI